MSSVSKTVRVPAALAMLVDAQIASLERHSPYGCEGWSDFVVQALREKLGKMARSRCKGRCGRYGACELPIAIAAEV